MSILANIAVQAGFPLIQKVLAGKMGDANGRLASDIVEAIAARAGIAPEALEAVDANAPGRVIDAMREVESAVLPEKLALFMKDTELQLLLAQAEQEGPAWARAWRPAGMYLIGFLWLWTAVLLHVANAIWKIALPQMPFEQLFQISAAYMALYMGGHTAKDLFGKWVKK